MVRETRFGTRRKMCDEDRMKDTGGTGTVRYRTAAGDGNVDCDAGMGSRCKFWYMRDIIYDRIRISSDGRQSPSLDGKSRRKNTASAADWHCTRDVFARGALASSKVVKSRAAFDKSRANGASCRANVHGYKCSWILEEMTHARTKRAALFKCLLWFNKRLESDVGTTITSKGK